MYQNADTNTKQVFTSQAMNATLCNPSQTNAWTKGIAKPNNMKRRVFLNKSTFCCCDSLHV